FIGGLNKDLRKTLQKELVNASLNVSFLVKFKGTDEDNICNRETPQGGVQFELTASFRNDAKLRNRFIQVVRENLSAKL
ncbi:poly-gamma-glutamate hydrolase family protein, partial [Sulfurovum riftiae]